MAASTEKGNRRRSAACCMYRVERDEMSARSVACQGVAKNSKGPRSAIDILTACSLVPITRFRFALTLKALPRQCLDFWESETLPCFA